MTDRQLDSARRDSGSGNSQRTERISQDFVNELNRHGHPLQHALARLVRQSAEQLRSTWRVEPTEFPVVVRGAPFHIDLVLSRADGTHLLAVECKRVQPKFNVWMFAADSGGARPPVPRQISRELLIRDTGAGTIAFRSPKHIQSAEFADVGHEVKLSQVRGDSAGVDSSGRKAIDDAATQATRGVNGLVNHIAMRIDATNFNQRFVLEPVIVTTAELFVHPTDISDADLETGNIRSEDLARRVPWLCLDRVTSPGIKHNWTSSGHHLQHIRYRWLESLRSNPGHALRTEYETDYLRTVYVVSAVSFLDFLNWVPDP